ncbi:Gfo/Idh/MocA family oxidoreductase [Bacillus safensis]|uniref:Gfo/Idh/MocA family protein n=1 Tax=Bacillus TaxID=1386 RepID=UPI0006FA8A29|nr:MULTISPECIES: Gfo/Idh/MocA family oxidoreductase [Bacillus]KRE19301.1 oxidoreductase [Bacillus sp. Root920]MCM3366096.1 Gfo/Idh/MocA family oxidoreductase [Bacillus safensis]MCY7430746.1 Gfo/Idh/MocA family oxidoreductase [Bacillus safensis]MDJ0289473.1 Gfo/Idh/MocA family oxidoreductase [Bacillus safensis]MED0863832.1 Gfo/Idh/MocA family oxidoreductase [Bacillus safensis]
MIRFAVIGTNWITDRFLQAGEELADFTCTAVYSRSAEKGQAFAEKYGIDTVFTNLQQMAESDTFDAVYIASPNALHKEQAMLMMEHQKHVLCEKPFASHRKEVEEMIAAAKKHHVCLMEAMKTTFLPNFLQIKQHLDQLGPIRQVVAHYCKYSSRYDAYRSGELPNAFKPELSNGSLMDIGVYLVYPVISLFGLPNQITARGYKLSSGVDGNGSVLLQYDGHQALLFHSKISTSHLSAEIQGEDATMVIDQFHRPSQITIYDRDGHQTDISLKDDQPAMSYEMNHFIECIQQGMGQSPVNTFALSVQTMSVMDEARRQMGVMYPADRQNV